MFWLYICIFSEKLLPKEYLQHIFQIEFEYVFIVYAAVSKLVTQTELYSISYSFFQ